MTRVCLPLAAAGFFAVSATALAQPAPTPAPAPAPDVAPIERDGRFSMTPAPGGGFLRLDTRTGAVAHCRILEGSVQCRSGADEQAALQAEIDRLAKENEELRRKLAQGSTGDRLRNALPSDEEVNKALSWMEQFMRRMMRVLREEQPKDRI